MMTEEMKKRYEKSLESTPGPIRLSDMKQDMDLRGIMAYAKAQGKRVIDLSDEEKARFICDKKMTGVVNMCDLNRYYKMYQEIKELTPDNTLRLMMHANSKDEQTFWGIVGNFLLQKKQKELIEKQAY